MLVDDQQGNRGDGFHVLLASAVDDGFGELFQQDVGLPIQDAIALLDGGLPDGLSQMALAGAARAEEERILAPADERAGG